MSTAGDSENYHVASHASNSSTSMDNAPQLKTSATTGASDSLGPDTALHSLVRLPVAFKVAQILTVLRRTIPEEECQELK